MKTLHTFGCSITQGYALPDVVNPVLNDDGKPYTQQEINDKKIKINWEDIHILKPSDHAWPKVLADKLNVPVINPRRGACFPDSKTVCSRAKDIQPSDTVIVMWTYLSHYRYNGLLESLLFVTLLIQLGWKTVILGFNRFLVCSVRGKHK